LLIHNVLYNGNQYCHQRIFSNTVVIISDIREQYQKAKGALSGLLNIVTRYC